MCECHQCGWSGTASQTFNGLCPQCNAQVVFLSIILTITNK